MFYTTLQNIQSCDTVAYDFHKTLEVALKQRVGYIEALKAISDVRSDSLNSPSPNRR